MNKYLIYLGASLIVSGGYQDYWETLNSLPFGDDGTAFVRSNIRVLPRGGRTQVEGLVVGALGAAFSVDYRHRTEGKDWWADEEPLGSKAERTRALIREVVHTPTVPHLFCGHWHQRSTYRLPHPHGTTTRVDALDMENSREGNGVLV